MKIKYKKHRFRQDTLKLLATCTVIIDSYLEQGYSLTLRQLYYQLVARDLIPNTEKMYKKLTRDITNAKEAGLISWEAIEDRTRFLRGLTHWNNPKQILKATVPNYHVDLWVNQPYRVEVWVEKDALVDVVSKACNPLDVPYFSCRGYVSSSEMWVAGYKRCKAYLAEGQIPLILHLGDLDPSGVDMTRDIEERLATYSENYIEVKRIALHPEHVTQYTLPPNPAKISDTRAVEFIERYGVNSWELDALPPTVLKDLITDEINQYLDTDAYEERVAIKEAGIATLKSIIAGL